MKTKLIMGTKNQNFLNYLDKEILMLRNKSKYFTYAGSAIILAHFLISQVKSIYNDNFVNNNVNNNDNKVIDQKKKVVIKKSQEDNILEEINKF